MENNSQKFHQLLPLQSQALEEEHAVVLLRSSISHVFNKFKNILLLAAQLSRFLTSACAVFELPPLIVMSSTYFEILLFESTSFISFTVRENKSGPRNVP